MATEPTNGRNVVVGLAVTVSRAGATAGRSMLWPVRIVEGLPFVRGRVDVLAATGREAELDSRRRLEGVAESVLAAPEAGRALDSALAGPLPESVSRSLVQHQVMERVARETLDDRQTAKLVETILSSPEFEAALHRVVSSPALREALTQQGADFGDQVMTTLRGRAYQADGALERKPRAWTHRAARTEAVPYAGFVSRGVAFAIDLLVVTAIFVIGSALVGLASSVVGGFRPQWLAVAIAGVRSGAARHRLLRRFLGARGPDAGNAPPACASGRACRHAAALRPLAAPPDRHAGSRSCRSALGCCRCSSTTGGARCRTSSRARPSSAIPSSM